MPLATMQSDGGLSDISNLLQLVSDKTTTSSTSTNLTQAGVQAQINNILSSNQGLAAVAGAQHSAGFYNSTVNTQLVNDLLTQAAAQVEANNATKTTTTKTKAPISSKLSSALSIFALGKKAYSSLGNVTGTKSFNDGVNAADKALDEAASNSGDLGSALSSSGGGGGGIDLGAADYSADADILGGTSSSDLSSLLGSSTLGDTASAASLVGASADTAGLDSVAGSGIDLGTADYSASTGALGLGDAAAAGEGASDAAAGTDAIAGLGEGAGAATGWAALAAFGAADLNQDIKSGNNDVLAADLYGGMGTGDIVGAAQNANNIGDFVAQAAGPAAGLVNNVEDNLEDFGGSVANATGWIICTELVRQNRMPRRYYVPGLRVFNSYRIDLLDGYYVWARPCVSLLKRKPVCIRSRLLCWIFNARAEYLAARAGINGARDLVTGQIISAVVYGFCYTLGQSLKVRNGNRSVRYS